MLFFKSSDFSWFLAPYLDETRTPDRLAGRRRWFCCLPLTAPGVRFSQFFANKANNPIIQAFIILTDDFCRTCRFKSFHSRPVLRPVSGLPDLFPFCATLGRQLFRNQPQFLTAFVFRTLFTFLFQTSRRSQLSSYLMNLNDLKLETSWKNWAVLNFRAVRYNGIIFLWF